MADYDRGAYTPQTDAPLAFDPRRPKERRPMPMALIGSAVVLVVLLAGVAMVYRSGVRHAGEGPRPVGEPVMAVKTAPPTPAPVTDTSANMGALPEAPGRSQNSVAAAPAFAPTPEQPAARPAPKASTLAMLAKPAPPPPVPHAGAPVPVPAKTAMSSAQTPAAAVQTPPARASSTKTADATVGAAKTAVKAPSDAVRATPASRTATLPKPGHAPADRIDPAELAAAGMTRTQIAAAERGQGGMDTASASAGAVVSSRPHRTAPARSAALASGAASPVAGAAPAKASVVQIGAFSSTSLADKGYADVSGVMAPSMGGKAKHVQPLQKDGQTLYRAWLSGFASRADAVAFCDALKAKGKSCFVKG